MRNLAARGHRITLLAQVTEPPAAATLAKLTPLLERLIIVQRRRRFSVTTISAAAFAPFPVDVSINGLSRHARTMMKRLLEEVWDVVQVEHGYGLQSYLGPLERRRHPFVLTEHNVESSLVATNDYHPRIPRGVLPLLRRYDTWRYRNWERRALAAPARLIAVTQQDADGLAAIAGRSVDVVPNGADCAAFAKVQSDASSMRVMFIGNYGYPPNDDAVQWAAGEIMPRVWKRIPEARFIACGSGMRGEWKTRWPDPRIEWRGFVDDVAAVQGSCAVFLASLRSGGGSKLKVLEAMAAGLPVVSTPEGVSGLTADCGRAFLLGCNADELAECLIRVLTNPGKGAAIGEAGRQYVNRTHDWTVITSRLEDVYRNLPSREARRASRPTDEVHDEQDNQDRSKKAAADIHRLLR